MQCEMKDPFNLDFTSTKMKSFKHDLEMLTLRIKKVILHKMTILFQVTTVTMLLVSNSFFYIISTISKCCNRDEVSF